MVSYDLHDFKALNQEELLTNIEYRLGNVLDDPRLLSAPLILLDTNHDRVFEAEFLAHLEKHNYQGLLVIDDIYLNAEMINFWKNLKHLKEDVTDLGHWSGTGLVAIQNLH